MRSSPWPEDDRAVVHPFVLFYARSGIGKGWHYTLRDPNGFKHIAGGAALPHPPRTVIGFRGGAVKLISTDRKGYTPEEQQALDEVAGMIRQFKKDGVKMEVCMYAVKVVGVDPATLMPEVDRVGNGFISVLGYQAQGYALESVH